MATNTTTPRLEDQYLAALRSYLARQTEAGMTLARTLGRQAGQAGMETFDLLEIHERALVVLLSSEHPPNDGNGTIVRAGLFFRQALTLLTNARGAAGQLHATGKGTRAKRSPGTGALAAAHERLQREIGRRKAAEEALLKAEQHYGQLLAQSLLMQEQLRHLSHDFLMAQEEERKHISRELHDEISQILTGINVRLAALKLEATANTGTLKKNIGHAQRLVERSVAAVHRFARELRPAMLDDLGLTPALLTFMKEFGTRTGLRICFTSPSAAKLTELDSIRRTVLYRIAQEALINIHKHAHASTAQVSIHLLPGSICMEIADDGKGFDVAHALNARRSRRLGVLGMRERAEMVGGTFAITSAPGKGTTVRVQIPPRNGVHRVPARPTNAPRNHRSETP